MEEMQEFIKQFEELSRRVENIEEVGVVELKRVFEELSSLDSRAGISIENYANDSDNDVNDKYEALKVWTELKENIRVKEIEVLSQYRARKEILDAKYAEYRRVKEYRRENQKRINEFKFELDKHKALLNHISDSLAKDNMEETIKDDEKHIAKAEELNERYNKELLELDKECRLLLKGGKLSTKDKVDEEDIVDELDRDKPKEEEQKEEKEEKEEIVPTTPELPKPRKITVTRDEDEEDKDLNKFIAPEPEKEDKSGRRPLPPTFASLTEDKEEEEEEKLTRRPLPPKFGEDEEEEEEDNILVNPPVEDEEEEKEDIDEDLDEEVTAVDARVVPPKASIWKKLGGVIVKAVAFLAMLGTAVHTGLMVGRTAQKVDTDTNKDETIEETEEEKTEEKKESKTEKKTEEKKEEKKEENVAKKTETKETEKKESKQEEKKEEKKKEEPKEEETLGITLNPGESVYNTDTGVEVGYNGNSAVQNEDGSVDKQKDRNLEHNDENQAIVKDEDLQKDTETKESDTKTVPLAGTTERSGYEVSEEEAKSNMTPEERNVADAEEEAWFQMLEEQGLGR